ncbi:MAG: hypothetical protein ABSB79_12520, partial [Syntrophales bacterium]
TGLIFTGQREVQNYSASLDYRLQDLTTATMNYNYETDHYNLPGYTDWWNQSTSLELDHDLSQWVRATKGFISFGYDHYHFESNPVDNYTGILGFKYDYNEKWSLLMDGGPCFTQAKFMVQRLTMVPPFFFFIQNEEQTSKGWGSIAQITMMYKDEYTTANVSVNKSIMPGISGATDRTVVNLGLQYRFTYELQGLLNGGYYLNKSDPGQYSIQGINYQTLLTSLGLRYEFSKDVYLETSYGYAKTQDRNNDTIAERNLYSIKFYVQHSLFE